ncbi:LppX_LprAFG lipoprotein [Nocardia vaccinii]|uniref:LppX_LprAFG lipoprotein n=1 Tax=Nocardia vaccinii TaxID=1822 RepID=UPI00082EC844|nr:LppX_LprAFG lipoprotein [Nocardia vaccinii]
MLRIRLVWAAVAVLVALPIAGCGDGSGGLPDADLLVRDAAIGVRYLKSAHIALQSEGAVPGFPVRALQADLFDGGSSGTGSVTTTSAQVIHFAETSDGIFTVNADGTRMPVAEAGGLPRLTSMIGDNGLAKMLDELQDTRTVARQDADGIDAFRIEAKVPASAMTALLPAANSGASLATWVRVRGAHTPIHTVLTFPGGATLDLRVSPIAARSKSDTR